MNAPTAEPALTPDEMAFVRRMLPHFMAGKSAVEAAEAVIEDDARLLNAVADTSHGYLGFNDAAHTYTDHVAKSLATQLSARAYARLAVSRAA